MSSIMANRSASALVKSIAQFKELVTEDLAEKLRVLEQYTFENLDKLSEEVETKKTEMEELMTAKQSEIDGLGALYAEKQRVAKVNMDMDLKEYGYSIATDYVHAKGDEIISKDELEKLQSQVSEYKESFEDFKAELTAKFEEKAAQERAVLEANNKTQIAKLEAELNAERANSIQKDDVIKHLRDSLDKAANNIVQVAGRQVNVTLPRMDKG